MEKHKVETAAVEDLVPGFHVVRKEKLTRDTASDWMEQQRGVSREKARLPAEPIISNSKVLDENLRADGWSKPGEKYEAAHIVPSRHNNPDAVRARELIAEADIYINETVNGLYAPAGREGDLYGDEAGTFHSETHTSEFFADLVARLEAVHPDERGDVLNAIRNELIDGTWKPIG